MIKKLKKNVIESQYLPYFGRGEAGCVFRGDSMSPRTG